MDKTLSTAKEAKSLVWWITFCVAQDGDGCRFPRFQGDRKQALEAVVATFKYCEEWTKHCQLLKIENPNQITEEPETVTEEPETGEEFEIIEEYETETSSERDEFETETSSEFESDNEHDWCHYDEDGNYTIDQQPPINRIQGGPVYREEFMKWQQKATPCRYEPTQEGETLDMKDQNHWHVACKETPMDMNVFLKRKRPCNRKLFIDMLKYLKYGLTKEEVMNQQQLEWQVVRDENAFSIARFQRS